MKTYTRRSVLQGMAIAGAAANLPRFASAFALKPSPVKLGIASYTFRAFKQPQQLVDFLKQLNIKYVNLKDFHLPEEPMD